MPLPPMNGSTEGVGPERSEQNLGRLAADNGVEGGGRRGRRGEKGEGRKRERRLGLGTN